jgi:hypothetical protein
MANATVRRLPNAAHAVVEARRLREYLLNSQHASGGPKARFFIAHGFASDAWVLLRASLRVQGRVNIVTRSVETEWGMRHTVECDCPTPDGRNPGIRTVWQMESGVPRLLTAIPL